MSENDTGVIASTVTTNYTGRKDPHDWILIFAAEKFTSIFVFVLSSTTVLCGITSWCKLKKFRNHRNYVYLNAILVNVLLYLIKIFAAPYIAYSNHLSLKIVCFFLLYFLIYVRNLWLLVICHMFYLDFVQVFDSHIHRRYLKSSIFAWGFGFLATAIYCFVSWFYPISTTALTTSHQSLGIIFNTSGSQIFPLIGNCCFYILIVYSLSRSYNKSTITATNIWRRLYIATLIFVLSDIIMLSQYFLSIFGNFYECTTPFLIDTFLDNLNAIILPIFLVFVKSNREILYDFYLIKNNELSVLEV